jgi:hypothetical protein
MVGDAALALPAWMAPIGAKQMVASAAIFSFRIGMFSC